MGAPHEIFSPRYFESDITKCRDLKGGGEMWGGGSPRKLLAVSPRTGWKYKTRD